MARTRQARRCTALRSTDRQPCKAWAMVGGRTCRAHGGATRQARQAAEQRLAMSSLRRAVAHAERRLAERRVSWRTERICWAAGRVGEDPVQLAREVRQRGWLWLHLLVDGVWPAGLGPDDEPQYRVDRRFCRRPA